MSDEIGWRAFSAWALCGVLWSVPWFSFGPGVVALPLAGMLTWALGRHAPNLRDSWGLAFGIGAFVCLTALSNENISATIAMAGGIVSAIALLVYRFAPGYHKDTKEHPE